MLRQRLSWQSKPKNQRGPVANRLIFRCVNTRRVVDKKPTKFRGGKPDTGMEYIEDIGLG